MFKSTSVLARSVFCAIVDVQIEAINVLIIISVESPTNRTIIDATNWHEIIVEIIL